MVTWIQDLNNFESDPEEFARIFCKDLGIDDPEVGVSITFNKMVFVKVTIFLLFQTQSGLVFLVETFKVSGCLVATTCELSLNFWFLFSGGDF